MSTHNQRLGQFGEDAAADWYRNAGYQVLTRNWRVREGELDLVCATVVEPAWGQPRSIVAFVEVKTRTTQRFGGGHAAVDWKKQKKLRQLAQLWLRESSVFYDDVRFDVADVDARGHLQVWEDAF